MPCIQAFLHLFLNSLNYLISIYLASGDQSFCKTSRKNRNVKQQTSLIKSFMSQVKETCWLFLLRNYVWRKYPVRNYGFKEVCLRKYVLRNYILRKYFILCFKEVCLRKYVLRKLCFKLILRIRNML